MLAVLQGAAQAEGEEAYEEGEAEERMGGPRMMGGMGDGGRPGGRPRERRRGRRRQQRGGKQGGEEPQGRGGWGGEAGGGC